jgi:hypothetical protein
MERIAINYFATHPDPEIRRNLCNQEGGGGGRSKTDRPKFAYIPGDIYFGDENSPGENESLTKGLQTMEHIQALGESGYQHSTH